VFFIEIKLMNHDTDFVCDTSCKF